MHLIQFELRNAKREGAAAAAGDAAMGAEEAAGDGFSSIDGGTLATPLAAPANSPALPLCERPDAPAPAVPEPMAGVTQRTSRVGIKTLPDGTVSLGKRIARLAAERAILVDAQLTAKRRTHPAASAPEPIPISTCEAGAEIESVVPRFH